MAKRILRAQLNPVCCAISDEDYLVTKPNLAMTPSQVKELTDKGIAVSLPNEKQFLDGSDSKESSWSIDAAFQRGADMPTLWELEQTSKSRVIAAHKMDKKRYGE